MSIDPYALFTEWFEQAQKKESSYPDAMSLATLGEDGFPDVRIVLMKEYSPEGFKFYTNYESKKGHDLKSYPKASLCFYWKTLEKQVRITGSIQVCTKEQSDKYFASRARLSQIGAWASIQSRPMKTSIDLEKRVAEMTLKFGFQTIPRPEHWGGYHLTPHRIEFWEEGKARLHRRRVFTRTNNNNNDWQMEYIFP